MVTRWPWGVGLRVLIGFDQFRVFRLGQLLRDIDHM